MTITEDSSKHPLWYSLAALAAILPAIGTALAVRGVIKVFEGMAQTGSGGVGTVAIGLYEANWPLIIAVALAAILAGGLAVTVLRNPPAFPGLLLSLAPVLGCAPALVLWKVESLTLEVIDPSSTAGMGSVADVSQHISRLVIASFGGSAAVIFIVIGIFAFSLARRPRSTDSPLPPVAVWAVMTLLLLGLAATFYMRSAYLYQVGQTGQL